jgi:hypothetical protein
MCTALLAAHKGGDVAPCVAFTEWEGGRSAEGGRVSAVSFILVEFLFCVAFPFASSSGYSPH